MNFLEKTKAELESLICAEHGERATFELTPSGFSITCICCDRFKQEIIEQAAVIMSKHVKNELIDAFKN